MSYDGRSMKSLSLAAAASCLLTACGGMTMSCEPPPPISKNLTRDCPPRVLASEVGWMTAHEQNSVADAECRVMYDKLREALEERQSD